MSISCTKLMSLSVASVGGDESDEYDEPFEEPKCMYVYIVTTVTSCPVGSACRYPSCIMNNG